MALQNRRRSISLNRQAVTKDRLTLEDFQALRDFLEKHCGINLAHNKRYLVQSRLKSILSESGCYSLREMILGILGGSLPVTLRTRIIDALTTNETFWFRESKHFDFLQEHLLPHLSRQQFRTLRVWSAACSTGQEPYSLAICAFEACRNGRIPRVNLRIVGTDLSRNALDTASRATYTDLSLSRGLTDEIKQRYFIPCGEGRKLKPEITNLVRFQQFNLLKPFEVLGKFDLIFCRNVLIYFSQETKTDILQRMARALQPGGLLFLSNTESMPPGIDGLTIEHQAGIRYYRREGGD